MTPFRTKHQPQTETKYKYSDDYCDHSFELSAVRCNTKARMTSPTIPRKYNILSYLVTGAFSALISLTSAITPKRKHRSPSSCTPPMRTESASMNLRKKITEEIRNNVRALNVIVSGSTEPYYYPTNNNHISKLPPLNWLSRGLTSIFDFAILPVQLNRFETNHVIGGARASKIAWFSNLFKFTLVQKALSRFLQEGGSLLKRVTTVLSNLQNLAVGSKQVKPDPYLSRTSNPVEIKSGGRLQGDIRLRCESRENGVRLSALPNYLRRIFSALTALLKTKEPRAGANTEGFWLRDKSRGEYLKNIWKNLIAFLLSPTTQVKSGCSYLMSIA